MISLKILYLILINLFVNIIGIFGQTTSGFGNYTVVLDYPFQVNLTNVKIYFETHLNNLIASDPKQFACLRKFNFNFSQLPAMTIYTPLETLTQVSQEVKKNRTILFAGYSTYFGKLMVGWDRMNDTNSFVAGTAENTTRLSNYWFNESLYLNIIHQMLLSTVTINDQIVIVVYSEQSRRLYPFGQRLALNALTKDLVGVLTVFYYNNSTTLAIIAAKMTKLTGLTTVITILTGEDTNLLLQASYSLSLIRWSVRWIIGLLEGKIDFSNTLLADRDSRNATVLTFGPGVNDTWKNYSFNSVDDAFTFDLMMAVVSSLSYDFSCATLPKNMSGITGNTGFFIGNATTGAKWSTTRSSYVVRTYRRLSTNKTLNYIGDILLDGDYNIISSVPPLPTKRSDIWPVSKVVKILFYKNEPDNIINNSIQSANRNDKFGGYMVNLLKRMLDRANIKYDFYEADLSLDTGKKDQKTGIWSGIFGLVQNGTYDLSSSLLTWTPERAADFDVVRGVMYYSFSLLVSYNKPDDYTSFFQFLNPLNWTVWLAVLGTIIVVSLCLSILHYIRPNDNDFSIYESFFFIAGSILHGVTVDPPNRYSGRLMACAFWYFSFVTFSIYIANYGAALTKEHLQPSLSSVEELLQATQDYTFGTYKDSLLFDTLASSKIFNQRILAKMMAYDFKNATLAYTDDVIAKMKNGNFVFIDESPNNQYRAYYYCLNNTGFFGRYEYVLYLSKYSELTGILQTQLDALNDNNELERLQSESWPTATNPNCVYKDILSQLMYFTKFLDELVAGPLKTLRFHYMAGIFIIMFGGCLLCIILAVFEWIFRATIQRMALQAMRRQNRQHLSNQ